MFRGYYLKFLITIFWTAVMVLKFLFSFTCTQLGPSQVYALLGHGQEALSEELCQLWHRQHSHSFTSTATWQPQTSWALCLCSEVLVLISMGQQESRSYSSYWCSTIKCEQWENTFDAGSFRWKTRSWPSPSVWPVCPHGQTSLRSRTHLFRWNYPNQPCLVPEGGHSELTQVFCTKPRCSAQTPPVFWFRAEFCSDHTCAE